MSKKFKVLKQITAIILCISLLSSQMTITYADETENSDMENGVDAYEQSYEEFSSESENSDPAETTGSTEVDSEHQKKLMIFRKTKKQEILSLRKIRDFQTEKNRKIIQRMLKKMSQIHWKKQNLIMQMEKSVSTITASFY